MAKQDKDSSGSVEAKEEKSPNRVAQRATSLKHRSRLGLAKLWTTKKGKAIVIISGVILLLAILFAIPFTRFLALGPIIKKDVTITVVDSITKQPVSDATVALGGSSALSDKNGVAKLKAVSVGQPGIKVTKQYYRSYSADYTVPVVFSPASPTVALVANGRQIVVTVTNKISGEPIADILVSSSNTKATTNADGKTTIILPPNQDTWSATLSGTGYNSSDVKLVDDTGTKNTYSVTPSGSVYFLSKITGKINVMKSNLDGTNATVVVEGTGQEDDNGTSLLSSRDWQYSVLLANRDGTPKVYLIGGAKGDFSTIDEGDASFQLVGWQGHNFIYIVTRNTANTWDDKREAMKSFNADTGKLTTIDETFGTGLNSNDYQYQTFDSAYIIGNQIVYTEPWQLGNSFSYQDSGKKMAIVTNTASGDRKVVKEFPQANSQYPQYYVIAYIDARAYSPGAIYYRVVIDANRNVAYYEYENGAVKLISTLNDDKFYSAYPTYLISPTGNKTFWYDPRDGKNSLLIGDSSGANSTDIGDLQDYTPYGWFGGTNDEYVLLSKNSSELYISPANKVIGENGTGYQPLKITDYHKAVGYYGYGSGYGGQ